MRRISIEKNQFSSFLVCFLTLLASILIQLGTNFINDLYDFLSGADDINRLGPQRAVQSGILTTNQMILGAYLCFLLALIIGFYLVFVGGLPILIIGSFALISAYCYTAGPYPLGYNG